MVGKLCSLSSSHHRVFGWFCVRLAGMFRLYSQILDAAILNSWREFSISQLFIVGSSGEDGMVSKLCHSFQFSSFEHLKLPLLFPDLKTPPPPNPAASLFVLAFPIASFHTCNFLFSFCPRHECILSVVDNTQTASRCRKYLSLIAGAQECSNNSASKSRWKERRKDSGRSLQSSASTVSNVSLG